MQTKKQKIKKYNIKTMKKIHKILLGSISLLLLTVSTFAQQRKTETVKAEHKIIFQLTTNDTTAHKQLMKQFNNILSVSPTTQIEVVCHGPGLDMLLSDRTIVEEKIKSLHDRGVIFNACEFSIKERKLEKSKIIMIAGFVPAGIIEIVSKQEQGWNYIKAGN
jgi:intracellular sulfur oxidation DsrE/DsrF family protein